MSGQPVTSIFEASILHELRNTTGWLWILRAFAIFAGVLLVVAGLMLHFSLLLILDGVLYLAAALLIHRYRGAVERVIASPERPALARAMGEHLLFWRVTVPCVLAAVALSVAGTVGAISPGSVLAVAPAQVTVNSMDATGKALEEYARDHYEYPRATTIAELRRALVPHYAAKIAVLDAWNRPFLYRASCKETPCRSYRLISLGANGVEDEAASQSDDIVHGDGVLLALPDGEKKP